ncbi:MAG: hypothetical protein HJJLKODD_02262 [Phycisphaerae bacterium]|nr:hypothetical protein [Phycisphaerae bacterium]
MRSAWKQIGLWLVMMAVGLTWLTAYAGPPRRQHRDEEATVMSGKLVDLKSYMSEELEGDELVRMIQSNLREGIPAAIETKEGLVVVGWDRKIPKAKVLQMANQDIEVRGLLYEKSGLHYMQVTAVRVEGDEAEQPEQPQEPTEPGDETPPNEEPAEPTQPENN